jgi:hypothetical protein
MVSNESDINFALFKRSMSVSSLILIITISSLTAYTHADSLNPGVYSKDSTPFGIPYQDWISKWWQWNAGIPSAVHPRDHYSPERCTINQAGPVWFLPDILTGNEERTCTMPSGKAILVPSLTGACWDDNTDPKLKTEAGIRQCASEGDNYGVISATLDGRNLQNLQQYRTMSRYFSITFPNDNVFRNIPGKFPAISDGFFVFLEPLPAGKHDLQLKTSVSNPIDPKFDYSSQVVYHLIIK